MHKTMAATALSFLMAVGGGVALADGGGSASSSSAATSSSDQHASRAKMQGPVGFAEEEVETGPWTVERIDKQSRDMVLRAADGTQKTVNIDTGTPGFDSLKKGDRVELDYFDAAVIEPATNRASTSNGSDQAKSASASGQSASSNAGNRKVRSIRKVGQNTSHTGGTSTNSASPSKH